MRTPRHNYSGENSALCPKQACGEKSRGLPAVPNRKGTVSVPAMPQTGGMVGLCLIGGKLVLLLERRL